MNAESFGATVPLAKLRALLDAIEQGSHTNGDNILIKIFNPAPGKTTMLVMQEDPATDKVTIIKKATL